MQNSNFFNNAELQEVDDADDTVYEYGLPSEEEAGLIGTVRNLYAPQRREVIKAPEEKQVPLEDLGMDAVPGETMTVKTPGEYGPVETDFSYAPIVRGAKSVLDYGKKLFSDKQTQEDTVEALKAAPAAAVEGGGKFLEDQMAAAMGMSAGYSSVNRPDGEVARFDPLAFTGAVAPAGIAAVSSAKAGETVLGIFGSTMGKGSRKRFDKFTEEAEKADDLEFDTPEAREEYLFQKSKGVFVDEAGDPRFEIATKDVDLLPYFKRRNLVEGASDSYEITPDPTMRSETVLADVLKFDELFNEYPALKNYIVEPLSEEDILDGTTGTFSPSTTTLKVAPQERKQFLSTLLHEVQHAVDDLEGLQSGSSTNMFTTFNSEHLGAERRNFFYFLTNKETSDSLDKYTPDELEILKSKEHKKLMPLAFSGLDFTKPMDELRDLYRPIIAKMADWEKENFDKLVQLQKESVLDSDEAYRKYRGTPGEVDARNVEKRFLNPELQLTSLPKNTADTDKLFGLVDKRGDKVSSVSETIPVFPKPERMFPEGDRPKGGKYLNPITGDDLTGMNVPSANIKINPDGRPSFTVTNQNADSVGTIGKGNTQIKTNLFKSKAGWKWKESSVDTDNINTVISVTHKGKHYYTLETDFSKGVTLKNYPESKTEPKLRPTVQGQVKMGNKIGTISVRGVEHPVYDKVVTFAKGGLMARR